MALFIWKPEYSVNNVELDVHHQHLFTLLNSVYENIMNSPEVDCVLPKIDDLSAYTKYHFSAEEQYMRDKGFQGIDEHIVKHTEFTKTLRTLRDRYHDNDLEVTRELIIVLGDWLLRHVLKEDLKYAYWASNSAG